MRRYWILEEQTFSQDLCNCCSSLWNLPVILVYFNISSELLGMERMLSTSEYVISSHFMRRGMAPSHCASGMFTKCWSCFEEFYCTYLHLHLVQYYQCQGYQVAPDTFDKTWWDMMRLSRLKSWPGWTSTSCGLQRGRRWANRRRSRSKTSNNKLKNTCIELSWRAEIRVL